MNKSIVSIPDKKHFPTVKTITKENKHLLSKEHLEVYEYILTRPIIFPERYLKAQKGRIKFKIQSLYQQQPDLSPKMVLITILQPMPDFIPIDMMQEICKSILEYWQEEVDKNKVS